MKTLQTILNQKEFIIQTAEYFNFDNVRIYPDIIEGYLSLIVDTNPVGDSNLDAAYEAYLQKVLGCAISVSPTTKLPKYEKDDTLCKSIALSSDKLEEELKEKFKVTSIDKISFKDKKLNEIEDTHLFLANKQLEGYENFMKRKLDNLQ